MPFDSNKLEDLLLQIWSDTDDDQPLAKQPKDGWNLEHTATANWPIRHFHVRTMADLRNGHNATPNSATATTKQFTATYFIGCTANTDYSYRHNSRYSEACN